MLFVCNCHPLGDAQSYGTQWRRVISWMDEAKLVDLDFADNIALLEESVYSMQHSTSVLEEEEWAK